MDGTRVEKKGREKAVACRRVERTAIFAVVGRESRYLEGLFFIMGRKAECRCRSLKVFTLFTFWGWV